jgi:16S rRNA (guanine1207-N2)-methyltransferase
MTSSSAIGLYGDAPAELVTVPSEAVQFSPLVLGSASLEAWPEASMERMIVVAPPGTVERRYVLAHALRMLKPSGKLVALAPKDKGGTRLRKELQMLAGNGDDAPRNHWRIATATRAEMLPALVEMIADGAPRQDEKLGLWTQPGIFSWDRLDAGSALLLKHLPKFSGQGADIGAGIGFLAQHVLQESPNVSHITLVELDARACALLSKNVDAARSSVLRADIRHGLPTLAGLDFVVMNPPFHDTGQEDRGLGLACIEAAAAALRKGGACWLVANRHLPYEPLLNQSFSRVVQHVQEAGYKIYEAVK